MSKAIVFAAPFFLLLIALEFAWGRYKNRNTYRLADAINSIGLGLMSQFTGVFTRLLRVGIYSAVFGSFSMPNEAAAQAFWTSPVGWLLALLFYDFCYYWLHRAGHECALLWAAHGVHHQSQDYNLSTALRQTSSGALFGWIFYLPMALAGVPPAVFGIVALIDLLYQFWVHTEHVGRLGWFDRWFVSPSNHRVHHAVNDAYLDKNYGGILIVWDRLFGSFTQEAEACVFGTRSGLKSWDPIWANLEGYGAIAQKWRCAGNLREIINAVFKAPGWMPEAMRLQKSEKFDLEAAKIPYEPLVGGLERAGAAIIFVVTFFCTTLFLWFAPDIGAAAHALGIAALSAALWGTGALLQKRLSFWQALSVFAAAAATTSAGFLSLPEMAASRDFWQILHWVSKPAVLIFTIIFVAAPAHSTGIFSLNGIKKGLLLSALSASLAGDIFLMLGGFFIPGLIAFLIAHLAYIALFKKGQTWFPSKAALLACLAYSAAMLGFLWPHLAAGLKLPVAVYVLAIACMGAQALGLALRRQAHPGLGIGAVLFMLSDSILAINKFVAPVHLSALWILSSYFAAQILIAAFAASIEDANDAAPKSGLKVSAAP